MTLDAGAVAANLAAMASWCADRGVALAPHGKTTMAPALWLAQLDAGARAITVANAGAAARRARLRVRSLVVANELVATAELRRLAAARDADPALEVLHWVDSVAAVERIDAALAGVPPRRPLTVCVELGAPGGRTGARTDAEVDASPRGSSRPRPACWPASAATRAPSSARAAPPRAWPPSRPSCSGWRTRTAGWRDRFETPVVTLTAGGSAHFDAVVDVLGPLAGSGTATASRSCCAPGPTSSTTTCTTRRSPPSTRGGGPALRPAIHVRAQVLLPARARARRPRRRQARPALRPRPARPARRRPPAPARRAGAGGDRPGHPHPAQRPPRLRRRRAGQRAGRGRCRPARASRTPAPRSTSGGRSPWWTTPPIPTPPSSTPCTRSSDSPLP